MVSKASRIDLKAIRFPSDRLTLEKIRQLSPGFGVPSAKSVDDVHAYNIHLEIDDPAAKAIEAERKIAIAAFYQEFSQGAEQTAASDEIKSCVSILKKFYVASGIASSDVHASALIGDIETSARQQAKSKQLLSSGNSLRGVLPPGL